MKSLLDEIWEIVLGIFGLSVILVVFVGLFRLAMWFNHTLAYAVGLVFWVVVAIAFAHNWSRR